MPSTVIAMVSMSMCPSVVCWYCNKVTQVKIMKSSPMDSPRTLVFAKEDSSRNSKGFTQNEVTLSLKWCRIIPSFMQFSNRKLHMCFWLVPLSLTLDDLEWQLCTLLHYTCALQNPPHKLNEDKPMPSAAEIWPRNSSFWLYSIRMDIRRSIIETREGCQTTVGGQKGQFPILGFHSSGTLVCGGIMFVWIFASILWRGGIKGQCYVKT